MKKNPCGSKRIKKLPFTHILKIMHGCRACRDSGKYNKDDIWSFLFVCFGFLSSVVRQPIHLFDASCAFQKNV